MLKQKYLSIVAIFIVMCFTINVTDIKLFAYDAPKAGIHELSCRVAVNGLLDSSKAGSVASVLLVKKNRDTSNVISSDIGYIGQTSIKTDGSYFFKFQFKGNIDDYEVLVNQAGQVVTSSATKAVAIIDLFKVDLELTKSDTLAKAIVKIDNLYNIQSMSYRLVLGFYTKEGRLVGLKTAEKSDIQTDITNSELASEIPDQTALIKAFIWDSTEKMIPLCKAQMLDLSQPSASPSSSPSATPEPPPPPPASIPFNNITKVEAENMTLTGYVVETNSYSSNGQLISTNGVGTAKFNYSGASGQKNIRVSYFDENDGASTYTLYVAGTQVDSWTANKNLINSTPDDITLTTRIINNVNINNGTEIKIQGTSVSSENACIDSVEVIEKPVADVIVDNKDKNCIFNGYWIPDTWKENNLNPDFYGTDRATATSSPEKWARFTPNIPKSGYYNIYEWHPQAEKVYANAVTLTIKYNGGIDTGKIINQRYWGRQWVYVGTYNLAAGTSSYVQIGATATSGLTVADAYKFEWNGIESDDGDLKIIPNFETASFYMPYDNDSGNAVCTVKYRESNSSVWNDVFTPFYDSMVPKMFRGSIVNLTENTEYILKVEITENANLVNTATYSFRTWTSTPTIGRIINIKDIYSGGVLNINNYVGSDNSWIKIVGDGTTIVDGQESSANACNITNSKYVIFENIHFRGGIRNAVGVDFTNSYIRFNNCEFEGWGRVGVFDGGYYKDAKGNLIDGDSGINISYATGVVVERCYFHDPRGDSNEWYGPKNAPVTWNHCHPNGPAAITLNAYNTVIRYNDFIGSDLHRWNDVISSASNGSVYGGFGRDSDVYGNMFAYSNDDIIELEGGQMNLRFFENKAEGAYCGLSLAPNRQGPSFIFRNLIVNLKDRLNYTWSAVKNGGGPTYSYGKQFFFNNTISANSYSHGISGVGYGDDIDRAKFFATTRNNIIFSDAGSSIAIDDNKPSAENSFDYDLLGNLTRTGGAGKIVALDGNEEHGIFGLPTFVNLANADYRLANDSLGVDSGLTIPNFADKFNGSGVDMGAFEMGKNVLFPRRPINITSDKYQINLLDSISQTFTLTVGSLAESKPYKIRKNSANNWLNVTNQIGGTDGTLNSNSTVTFTVTANPSLMSGHPYIDVDNFIEKAVVLIRLDNGYSIPITVMANK